MVKPISIFVSYAHEDEGYLLELMTSFKPFVRNKTIKVWTDIAILAGQKWDDLIKANLNECQIILFLVSRDFIASDYINDTEIKAAIENNKIPISVIIRKVELSDFALNRYQIIPSKAKPVNEWENKDAAWVDIERSLKLVFDKINGVSAEQIENSSYSKSENIPVNNIQKGVNLTDKLVLSFIMLLMCIGLVMLIYGIIKLLNGDGDLGKFNIYIGIALAGLGLFFYFHGRKSLSF